MIRKIFAIGAVFSLAIISCVGLAIAADPYVVGYQTDVTGPGNVNYAPQGEGFRLYMQALNARGGINGHPVKMIYEDDKSSPARSGAIAKKFILEDKVLLIAGLSFSHSHPPVYEQAKKYKVPVIVPFSSPAAMFAPAENDAEYIFSIGPVMSTKFHFHGYGEAIVLSKLFKKGTTVASMSYATPGGRTLSTWGANWAEKRGFKVVYHEDIPPGTVDVSSWAQQVAKINPDVLMASWGGEIVVPMLVALEKLGWNGAVLCGNFINTEDFLKAMKLLIEPKKNVYLFSEITLPPNFAEKSVPVYKKMQEAMKKYGHKYVLSARHASGWLTAMVVEAALKKAGWPATRASVLDALEKTNLNTEGLEGGPIIYTKTDHRGSSYIRCYRWDPDKKLMIDALGWIKMEPAKIAKGSN